MTEFEKATEDVKKIAVDNYRKKVLKEISDVYENEYPTASGEFDEFYRAVLKIISES